MSLAASRAIYRKYHIFTAFICYVEEPYWSNLKLSLSKKIQGQTRIEIVQKIMLLKWANELT